MSWNVASRLNPEFVRIARMSLPRRRAVFVAGLTLALVAAGGWLMWQKSEPHGHYTYPGSRQLMTEADLWAMHVRNFGRASFEGLTVILFGAFVIVAPALAGLSFVYERLRGTAVFQQMTLLSPLRQTTGKFFGSGLLTYFVAAMLVPLALFAAYLGETNPNKVLRIYLFLLVVGFCWQAVGLFCSASLAAAAEKPVRGGLLVGPLVAVGGAATALTFSHYFTVDIESLNAIAERSVREHEYAGYQYAYYIEEGRYWWRFYGATLPAYAVVLGVLAFAGAWAFGGAVRRVKAGQLIPTGPRAVWLFFASAEAVVVGLLWGRHVGDAVPNERLIIYLLLNAVALMALAGGTALGRGRLREWWSAERDPVALFQRGETRNALKTFLVVLGVAEAGLAALWVSYHLHPLTGELQSVNFLPGLASVGAAFALAMLGAAAFVQFCAMFRFHIGGWAGVALAAVFYVFVTLAGVMFETPNNTFALLNPLIYADTVTKGDMYLDSYVEVRESRIGAEGRGCEVVEKLVFEPPKPAYTMLGYSDPLERHPPGEAVVLYAERPKPDYDVSSARWHGLIAEGLLAVFCFALACLKWERTRDEMLGGGGAAAAS